LLTTNANLTNAVNPVFEAATNWSTLAMRDDGAEGDAVARDDIYTVALPPQANRTLVRYRITVADSLGASRRAPFEDDPSLNFAYYVYDGIPAYQTYSPAVLESLPVYTLLTGTWTSTNARPGMRRSTPRWTSSTNTSPRGSGMKG